MRTPEDAVQELKHKGFRFVAAVRKSPDEFPRFVVFQDEAGHSAVLMYTAYEKAMLLTPVENMEGLPTGPAD
jgi:hypothetical protein